MVSFKEFTAFVLQNKWQHHNNQGMCVLGDKWTERLAKINEKQNSTHICVLEVVVRLQQT